MSEYETFLVLTVSINGTGAVNTPELKYRDGKLLRVLMHREINLPPLFVQGMYICFPDDGGFSVQVSDILWDTDNKRLEIYGNESIFYYDQGPEELSGQDRVIAFFDSYVDGLLGAGWERGNP